MKKIILLSTVFIFSINSIASNNRPICDAIGTRAEGWYLAGELMTKFDGTKAWDSCADKMVTCDAFGSRAEGWYITSQKELLTWDNCSKN